MTFSLRNVGSLSLFLSLLGVVAGCTGGDDSAGGPDAEVVDAGPSTQDAWHPLGDSADSSAPPNDASGPVGAFTVGGTLKGLLGTGLVLRNNGSESLAVAADGAFTFASRISTGDAYAVSVRARPSSPAQICSVANGNGTMGSGNVTDVTVTCSVAALKVGGQVVGLAGQGLALQNEGGDDLSISKNGAFTFPTPIASGAPFDVKVKSQPWGPVQTCTVSGGSGTSGNVDVTSVVVNCGTNSYTAGGTVTGLGGALVLQNEGHSDLTVTANGSFAFSPQASGTPYSVTIKTQPSSPVQVCTVTNGSGTVTNASVTSIGISCDTTTFTLGGTVVGDPPAGLHLLNGGVQLPVSLVTAGPFTSTARILSGAKYSLSTAVSSGSGLNCSITNATGTVTNADVANVIITCPHAGWVSRAPMPTARAGVAATVGNDTRIYVLGGFGAGGQPLATAEAYTPSDDTWTKLPNMPTARTFLGAATGADGRIYAIGGGFGETALPTVEIYTPSTNTWSTGVPLAASAVRIAASMGPDGNIYAFGRDRMQVLTPGGTAWAVSDMPVARGTAPLGVANSNGALYVLGGGVFEAFKPGSGWSSTVSDPFMSQSILADAYGYLYSFGLKTATFDYSKGAWVQSVPVMIRPRTSVAAAGVFPILDRYFYVFGGTADGTTPLADVEVLR